MRKRRRKKKKLRKIKIKELTDMGFTEQQAKEALKQNDEDVEKAINFLVGS